MKVDAFLSTRNSTWMTTAHSYHQLSVHWTAKEYPVTHYANWHQHFQSPSVLSCRHTAGQFPVNLNQILLRLQSSWVLTSIRPAPVAPFPSQHVNVRRTFGSSNSCYSQPPGRDDKRLRLLDGFFNGNSFGDRKLLYWHVPSIKNCLVFFVKTNTHGSTITHLPLCPNRWLKW